MILKKKSQLKKDNDCVFKFGSEARKSVMNGINLKEKIIGKGLQM